MIARLNRLFHRKFVRDTLILQAGNVVTALFGAVSLVVTTRLMGPAHYGVWGLAQSLVSLSQTFDVTGIGMVTANGLALSIGRRDDRALLDLLAVYVKVSLAWAALTTLVLFAVAPPISAALYAGNTRIGWLAAWFSLTIGADALYTLTILVLRSRRSMRDVAVLQNVNRALLMLCVVAAVIISPTAESYVAGRLVYSFGTMLLALAVYQRRRAGEGATFPSLESVLRRVWTVSICAYWRAGVVMALDKNLSNLFPTLAVTLVGVFAGETGAGYLRSALDVINRSTVVTGAVLDNLQAVIPQAVGRGDYARLWQNLRRVILAMGAWGVGVYGALALTAPLLLPLFFGAEWTPAVPPLAALAIYGAVAAVGGIFGPLYRALDLNGAVLLIKIITALVMLPLGVALVAQMGALGGAWMVNGLFALSVALTAVVTLPALRRKAVSRPSSVVSG